MTGRPFKQFTDQDVHNLEVLVDAIDACIIGFVDDDTSKPMLMSTDKAIDVIAETHGGRGNALKVAQVTARALGRPVPRTCAAAAGDPVLAAHVARKSA